MPPLLSDAGADIKELALALVLTSVSRLSRKFKWKWKIYFVLGPPGFNNSCCTVTRLLSVFSDHHVRLTRWLTGGKKWLQRSRQQWPSLRPHWSLQVSGVLAWLVFPSLSSHLCAFLAVFPIFYGTFCIYLFCRQHHDTTWLSTLIICSPFSKQIS